MQIVCLDLEGVLVPEIWLNLAERAGVEALRATTRDIPDYDELMQQRLRLLAEHKLRLGDLQAVIGEMTPLPGARDFLDGLREKFQVIILSDTFYEFAGPLMAQLAWPTLLCHRLQVSATGEIEQYILRQQDPKKQSVLALQQLNFSVLAAGDSYNDISMLETAEAGMLFRASSNVAAEFPQFPVSDEYDDLTAWLVGTAASLKPRNSV